MEPGRGEGDQAIHQSVASVAESVARIIDG